jgi:hypothetical protein
LQYTAEANNYLTQIIDALAVVKNHKENIDGLVSDCKGHKENAHISKTNTSNEHAAAVANTGNHSALLVNLSTAKGHADDAKSVAGLANTEYEAA